MTRWGREGKERTENLLYYIPGQLYNYLWHFCAALDEGLRTRHNSLQFMIYIEFGP